jgi:hypothetical protein
MTPSWARWREGNYWERPLVFDLLLKAFKEWRTAVENKPKPNKHLPVFWIEGTPGDGKSVLLLQLLAACLREQLTPAMAWLEHSPDGRAFHAKPPADSGWVACAEIPTRAEGTVRDTWMAALINNGATALVTSGSSETRHGFEFRFEHCTQVTKFVLPPFCLTEAVHFAEWFSVRSGDFRGADSLWREGMSLTEFLFALQHGKPLAELTSDVRGALGNLGLGGTVRAVWLVNALGLRVPPTMLASDATQNHAAKIAERGIVPVEVGAAGLRLAPPAIVWPLVGTWLGKGHELPHLVDALALILKAWLDAGDEENAVRFLRGLCGTEWLMDEKPFGHGNPFVQLPRREVLRQLYRRHRRDFADQPAPATIPAWLELNETFSLMLLPDPVACATEIFAKPEMASRRTTLLAALVWLAADSRRPPVGSNARKILAEYFVNESGTGAGRALMRLVRDTKKIPEARIVGETWLKQFPNHPEALDVAGVLVKRAGNSEKFLGWVSDQFAQPSEVRPGAPKLLAAMLEGRPHDLTVRQRASAWAWSHALEPETGIIWLTLFMEKLAKEDVVRGAARWLAANPTLPQADAIRERLLKHYPQAFEAAWVMSEWLPKHSDGEQTPELLLQLLRTQPNNRKLDALILEWISHHLSHPVTPKLLRLLTPHPTLELQAVAERWFEANPESASHAELLSVFIRVLRGVPKWIARGESHVADSHRHGREHVVAALLSASGCQVRHVRLALPLLKSLPAGARTFLETALGRSLAIHPIQAHLCFREFIETEPATTLARALARGLIQISDLQMEFLNHAWPSLDDSTRSLILFYLVRADVLTGAVMSVLLEWLQKNHRRQGYTPLISALHNHPAVWKSLLATGRLDRRVIADFQNFRARPADTSQPLA